MTAIIKIADTGFQGAATGHAAKIGTAARRGLQHLQLFFEDFYRSLWAYQNSIPGRAGTPRS